MEAMIGHRDGFGKALGLVIYATGPHRVHIPPVALRLVHPQPESYWGNVNPVGPRGVYDEAKRFAEAITMAYHRFHRLDTRIVRIFNTYGRSEERRVGTESSRS